MDTRIWWPTQLVWYLGGQSSHQALPTVSSQTDQHLLSCTPLRHHCTWNSFINEHKLAGRQTAWAVLVSDGMAFITRRPVKALPRHAGFPMLCWSLVPPPSACANHPSAFFWDQRRALGSLKPPQWLPAWCHASNLLLEVSPRLSCGLDVQRRLISDRMIMRWLWKQIPV